MSQFHATETQATPSEIDQVLLLLNTFCGAGNQRHHIHVRLPGQHSHFLPSCPEIKDDSINKSFLPLRQNEVKPLRF